MLYNHYNFFSFTIKNKEKLTVVSAENQKIDRKHYKLKMKLI